MKHSRALEVCHPALIDPGGKPLAEAGLTDRQRLAVVLQAAALLSHLDHGGWRLARDWGDAEVDPMGMLRRIEAEAGSVSEMSQQQLRRLLALLFRSDAGVAGRGTARKAARRLDEAWDQDLMPLAPDIAVAQVLESAPFLWQKAFAPARRALVAEFRWNGRSEAWVAGPGAFRREAMARGSERGELEGLLAGGEARRLWEAVRSQDMEGGNWTGADASSPLDSVATAGALVSAGRFEDALAALDGLPAETAGVTRAWSLYALGRIGAARRVLRELDGRKLSSAARLDATEVAVRVLASAGDLEAAADWVARALEGARGGNLVRARILAAEAAWDRGETDDLESWLEKSREALEKPELVWRWHRAAGLGAWARGDGEAAAEHLGSALALGRRQVGRFGAAGLWNDLGGARGMSGDLAGAERAFGHALRLYRGCDGPRKVTLALQNLAEARLRRGRLIGVREILERSSAENRRAANHFGQSYDTLLQARYELVHGRAEAALDLCSEALVALDRKGVDFCRGEYHVLSARALGWLGRPEEAAAELEKVGAEALSTLEPEELPALFALAGDRETALSLVRGPAAEVWRALLTARSLPKTAWASLSEIEVFRAARMVFDCDLVTPGEVPAPWRRRAIAALRRVGSGALAERLEALDRGPWEALGSYLGRSSHGSGCRDDLATLLTDAGHPEARLFWESGSERAEVLVDRAGGDEEISAPLAGGRLVLKAPLVDALQRALFALALRDFRPAAGTSGRVRGRGGMVGESPDLLAALERLGSLAGAEVPVMVLGESGTGKELAARHFHRLSPRSEGSFVPINCAALSESLLLSDLFGHVRGSFTGADRDRAGVFETAKGGTVFLDEIGDLPPSAQGMLLRVLQEGEVRRVGESLSRKVDVRVLTATHRDLEKMVGEGSFRQDLFYRLKGATVELPPLRDRGGDVLLLAEYFLQEAARRRSAEGGEPARLSPQARATLQAHPWPGNVRELQNALATAAALAATDADETAVIEPEHLNLEPPKTPLSGLHQQVDALKRRLLKEALAAGDGNQAEAARRLGVSRQAVSNLVRKLGLI